MNTTVGVREFRQGLAEFIDQNEPVTVTRHGQTVGLFIPVHRDRNTDIAAYAHAAQRANELLNELALSENEAVEEFAALRTSQRNTQQQ